MTGRLCSNFGTYAAPVFGHAFTRDYQDFFTILKPLAHVRLQEPLLHAILSPLARHAP